MRFKEGFDFDQLELPIFDCSSTRAQTFWYQWIINDDKKFFGFCNFHTMEGHKYRRTPQNWLEITVGLMPQEILARGEAFGPKLTRNNVELICRNIRNSFKLIWQT